MQTTRTVQALLVIATLTGCAGSKDAAKDSATAAATTTPAPAPAPAPKTLADFAGTWTTTSNLVGAAKPVTSTIKSSADGSTWTITFEGRAPVAMQASMSGDSLVLQSAEYESVLRKGVKVTTRSASVLTNGALSGNVVATYKTPKGDEKVPGTLSSVRAPK